MDGAESRYRVLFVAEKRTDVNYEKVYYNLKRLFQLEDAKLDELFCGDPVVIKNSVDHNMAMKFRTAIIEAGGVSWIEEINAKSDGVYQDRRQAERRDRDERRERSRDYTGSADRRRRSGRRVSDKELED